MKLIKQSQRHLNTRGMGILDVPGKIEEAGGKLWLSVQAEGIGNSPANWHSEFTVDEWNEFKKSLNDSGMTITDVWIDESKNNRSGNMKSIKSSLDDTFTVYPWSKNCWKYSDRDLGLSYVVEAYGDEFVNLDNNKLKMVKDELVKYFDDDDYVLSYNQNDPDYEIESIHDIMEPEELDLEELARYFDYEALGRDLRLGYNMAWDNKRNCWFSTIDVDESEYEDDVTYLGSSRKPVKSANSYDVKMSYSAGYDAFSEGKTLRDKPIMLDKECSVAWENGWKDAAHGEKIGSSKKPVKSARFIIEDESGTVIKSSRKIISAKSQEELNSIVDYYMDKWLETKDEVTNEEIKQHRKHLEEYVKQMEQRSVNSSRKLIKSANNYGREVDSSDAHKALDMWIEQVGEDSALEDVAKALSTDDLNENIDWVAQQWGFGEELDEIEDAWDKYEYAKDIMGTEELLTNLTQAIGYDELAECMAFIFRMNDFREWDSVTSSRKSVKSALSEWYKNKIKWDELEREVERLKDAGYDLEEAADYIFEENDIDQLDELGFIGDSFRVKYDILDAVKEVWGDEIKSSKTPVKSARYIVEDESGTVIGEADTYEEAKTLNGIIIDTQKDSIQSRRKPVKSSFDDDETIDVETIKEEWENEGYDPNVIEQFFDEEEVEDEITYSQEHELHKKFEKYNLNITSSKSSKKISNGNFPREITKAVLSNRMTQEEAITQICSRNKCNRGFAKNILSRWINEKYEALLKSDAEIADIQKEFDVDGDLESWAEDYMPGSGKANTKGGELVRAAMRIIGEYQNNVNMIGRGYGNESVNPAARYIVEKTSFSGNGEIEDMLNHVVQMTDSEYQSWLKRFQSDFENYLRDNSGLFSEPNDDDIADYIEDDDFEFFLREFYAEDSEGNQYHFKLDSDDPDSQFKCTDITFATEPLYEEGDEIEEGDELSNEIDKNEEYSEIEKDGVTYAIEAVGGEGENGFNKWKVTNVTIEDQIYEVGDVINVSELDESVTYFDNNGNTLTQDDFNRL